MKNKEKRHKHILFCSDGEIALGLARSLGEAGIKPILIQKEGSQNLLKYCRYISTIHRVKDYDDALDLLFSEYGNETEKPFVHSTEDRISDYLDEHLDELRDRFYVSNCGERGHLSFLLHKAEQNRLAEECGFEVPITEIISKGELPKIVPYPLITKADTSSTLGWKSEMHICNNQEELIQTFSMIDSPRFIVEEYIEKKNELEVAGVSYNGGDEVYLSYGKRCHRFTDKNLGYYIYYEPFTDEDLIRKTKDLIRKMHYTGIFDIEWIEKQDGGFVFLEVNLRAPLTNYPHTWAGVNLPIMYQNAVLSGILDKPQQNLSHFDAMNEISDFQTSVITKKVSLWNWLRQYHHTDTCLIYNFKDLKPFFVAWYRFLLHKLKSFLHLKK